MAIKDYIPDSALDAYHGRDYFGPGRDYFDGPPDEDDEEGRDDWDPDGCFIDDDDGYTKPSEREVPM